MKSSTGIILCLLLLAFALRVWTLSAQSIWWDEAFTWQITSHGPPNFWQMLLTGDRNPPLYFVSASVWGGLAGWSEFSLRFVSVAWSMVGLAFLFNLAKRLYNIPAGLWTLALAAVAPALVVYAQEARMYAAFFALTAATLYFAWRIFEFGNRRLIWAFLLCEAGLLLTHYFAIPLVATLNLFALIVLFQRRARASSYAKWIGGQILAALPIVIWTLIVFTTPGSLIKPAETPPDSFFFISQVIVLWLSGVRDLQGVGWGLLLAALPLLITALIGAGRMNGRSTLRLGLFGFSTFALAYLMTGALTSFHPRYLLPYGIPLFVLVGGAVSGLGEDLKRVRAGEKWRSTASGLMVAAVVLLLSFVLLRDGWQVALMPEYGKDDARGVAAYLRQYAAADDVILLEANDYTLNYYDHGPAQTKMITATTDLESLQQLRDAIGDAKRVWLPHWSVSTQDPRGYWPFLLEQAGSLKSRTSFRGYDLAKYEMQSPVRAPTMKPVSAQGMITQRSDLDGQGAEGALALALTWQIPETFSGPARASVRLIDTRKNTLIARDAVLLDERGRTTDHWAAIAPVTNTYILPIPPGTPPGTYTITAQLYDAREVLANEFVDTIDLSRRLDTRDPYGALDGYDWRVPANAYSAPGVMLEAYAVSSPNPQQPLDVTLRWRKTGDVSNFTPRLRLAQVDRVWNEIGSSLLERDYPIDRWVEGETVIDRLKIDYPPVRGPIDLQVGRGDHWITLATMQLDESRIEFTPPSMQHAQSAQFGYFAELLGYDLKSDSLSSVRPLDVKLYWRATNTEPITTPYTVFTQILAPDGHLVAQDDAPPDPSTMQWVPGQIVPNSHSIKVIDPAYRGTATLIVGWYNSASVERVPVRNGGDFVTLSVPVRIEDQ